MIRTAGLIRRPRRTLLCLLVVALWLANVFLYTGYGDGERYEIVAWRGAIRVGWGEYPKSNFTNNRYVGQFICLYYDGWFPIVIWPMFWLRGPIMIIVPLWPACAGAVLWMALGERQARRRMRPGLCRACGYDLTGNVSGRCPECGCPIVAQLRNGI